MTAALGRLPTIEAGPGCGTTCELGLPAPLHLEAGTLATARAAAEGDPAASVANMQVADCVSAAWRRPP